MSIELVAILKAKEGFGLELKNKLKALVTETIKEEGCIEYKLHSDTRDKNQFVFIEKWETRESLENHSASESIRELSKYAEEHIIDFKIIEISAL